MVLNPDNFSKKKPPPAGQRRYHHGDLRDGLVDAGMRLLEERASHELGLREVAHELGLREVAREVGVSATAVYRHFPDKGALLQAIAAQGFALLQEMQEKAAAGAGGRAFLAVGAAYVRFALARPAVFRLMFSNPPPADLFAAALDKVAGPMRLLRSSIAAAMGDAPPDAQRQAAIRAWALVHGLAMLTLDGMITLDDAAIEDIIAGGFDPAIARPGGSAPWTPAKG